MQENSDISNFELYHTSIKIFGICYSNQFVIKVSLFELKIIAINIKQLKEKKTELDEEHCYLSILFSSHYSQHFMLQNPHNFPLTLRVILVTGVASRTCSVRNEQEVLPKDSFQSLKRVLCIQTKYDKKHSQSFYFLFLLLSLHHFPPKALILC